MSSMKMFGLQSMLSCVCLLFFLAVGDAQSSCSGGAICDLKTNSSGWSKDNPNRFILDGRPLTRDTLGHVTWSYLHTSVAYLASADGRGRNAISNELLDYNLTAEAKQSIITQVESLGVTYPTKKGRELMKTIVAKYPSFYKILRAIKTRHDAILFAWSFHNLVSINVDPAAAGFGVANCRNEGHDLTLDSWTRQYFTEGQNLRQSLVARCIEKQYGIRWNWEDYNACRVSAYGAWSLCDHCVIGSKRSRARVVLRQPQAGGLPCPALTQSWACSIDKCPPTDCLVGEWGAWSECSKICGGGNSRRARPIIRMPKNGGTLCPALNEGRQCNVPLCVCTHVHCKYRMHGSGHMRIRVHHDGNETKGMSHVCKFDYTTNKCVCRCRSKTVNEQAAFDSRQIQKSQTNFFHYYLTMDDYKKGANVINEPGFINDGKGTARERKQKEVLKWKSLWSSVKEHW